MARPGEQQIAHGAVGEIQQREERVVCVTAGLLGDASGCVPGIPCGLHRARQRRDLVDLPTDVAQTSKKMRTDVHGAAAAGFQLVVTPRRPGDDHIR